MKARFILNWMLILSLLMVVSTGVSAQTMSSVMPDLSIVNISVDRACNMVVVVRNNGPGMLPDYVYTKHHPKSAGVFVYINGKGWGGQSIWKFDPGKKLQKPGGQTRCILNYKVANPINVKAVVDMHNDVREVNERNNSLVRNRLFCRPGGTDQPRKPDLTVTDIRLVQGCKIEVTVENKGSAGVPASYYDNPKAVAVQMYKGSKAWGGMILKMFDPSGKLKSPGGVAKHIWFPQAANLNLTPGVHPLKVTVDVHKVLDESDETNNTLGKRVRCRPGGTDQPRKPDLTVTDIRLVQGCKIEVTVENKGSAGVPASYYDNPKAVAVQMYKGSKAWGGMILKMFDPSGKLKSPGGVAKHIWFPQAANLNLTPGVHPLKVTVDVHKVLDESDETNNTLGKRVRCRPGGTDQPRKPDLTVTDIRLVQGCKIEVTVENKGSAGVPASYYDNPKAVAVQMYKGSKAWGGMILKMFDPSGKLKSPGGVAKHIWFPQAANLNLTPGVHPLKVTVDVHKVLDESDETNNTLGKRVRCRPGGTDQPRKPDLTVTDIRLVQGCKIEVTVENKGSAGVPASYYDNPKAVAVQMYKGSKAWGGMILKMFDPSGKLKSPGGVAKHIWFPQAANLNLTPGVHPLKVTVDVHKVLDESDESNNTLTKRVVCRGSGDPTGCDLKQPQRFFVHFNDAYLVYTKSSKSIQIAAQSNVLSYGGDWEKCQLGPNLFHIREKFWANGKFFWEVNTQNKTVHRVNNGSFCKSGGSKVKLNINVKDTAGSFFLYFKKATLVYAPASKTLQISTDSMVLSYGNDWQKCNLNNCEYHLMQNVWKGFFWKINIKTKLVERIKKGSFCKPCGPGEKLNVSLNVVN